MTADAQLAFDLDAPPPTRSHRRRVVAPQPGPEPRAQRPVSAAHPITDDELAQLPPTVDLLTAARILGIARTTAYRLVRCGQWPTAHFRAGERIRVPRGPLLALLAIAPNGAPTSTDPSASSAPTPASSERRSQSLTPPDR
ncbi:MAG TPA: helix-turn-helix domain-containing protein [Mycobacteriales bacterium]|nr:helix-turn-helix domain-containing protein [Mycobacteriales bacterium]